jgi:hypothetical protein
MLSRDIIWILLAVIVLALACFAAVSVWRNGRGKRRRRLQERFGPEYDRLLQQYNDPVRVERELDARARRVSKLSIKQLSASERSSFSEAWRQTQERFVDTPAIALGAAHDLIVQVLQARGYTGNDFEQRVADLSVDHANVVQHYRAANALYEANRQGREDTEELRQAMLHYHSLFTELVGEPREVAPSSRPLTTQHA